MAPEQPANQPLLKSLRPDSSLSRAKLDQLDRSSNRELMDSLKPGQRGALKVKPDGTIIDGHHRIKILENRGIDVNSLPREIIPEN